MQTNFENQSDIHFKHFEKVFFLHEKNWQKKILNLNLTEMFRHIVHV